MMHQWIVIFRWTPIKLVAGIPITKNIHSLLKFLLLKYSLFTEIPITKNIHLLLEFPITKNIHLLLEFLLLKILFGPNIHVTGIQGKVYSISLGLYVGKCTGKWEWSVT